MTGMDQVIYFVRHGETTWNLESRMQGHLDAPLTARGLREARRDGAALRALIEGDDPYALVFSPLGRTRETAKIIAEETRPYVHKEHSDARLREVSWGDWDGLTIADIKARYPEVWQAHIADRWNVGAPGGEMLLRAVRAGRRLAREHQGRAAPDRGQPRRPRARPARHLSGPGAGRGAAAARAAGRADPPEPRGP